mmetsp:Transcript_829/g.1154  ORF Transcript_829/g.1154 Transcript_829/m.1154 type:complete len:88 (+) Transcript_829:152-415(+)
MVELIHYKAINLARRLSAKNENDLLQESYYEEADDDQITYTKDMCSSIAQHLLQANSLPVECMKYEDIVKSMKSNKADMSHPTSWMS